MKVADVLKHKTTGVETVGAASPLRTAIERFINAKVRCLVVTDDSKVVGLLTMRDLLRVMLESGGALDQPVHKAMSADVASASPDTQLDEVQQLIAQRRINHVPVIEADRLVGVVTLADVLRTHADDIEGLNDELRRYISSPYTL